MALPRDMLLAEILNLKQWSTRSIICLRLSCKAIQQLVDEYPTEIRVGAHTAWSNGPNCVPKSDLFFATFPRGVTRITVANGSTVTGVQLCHIPSSVTHLMVEGLSWESMTNSDFVRSLPPSLRFLRLLFGVWDLNFVLHMYAKDLPRNLRTLEMPNVVQLHVSPESMLPPNLERLICNGASRVPALLPRTLRQLYMAAEDYNMHAARLLKDLPQGLVHLDIIPAAFWNLRLGRADSSAFPPGLQYLNVRCCEVTEDFVEGLSPRLVTLYLEHSYDRCYCGCPPSTLSRCLPNTLIESVLYVGALRMPYLHPEDDDGNSCQQYGD